MNREEVYEQLTRVFWDVFDNEDITINDNTTADDIDEWDSMEYINLIMAVEEEFSIKFTMEQVNGMKNVGEMVGLIIEKVKAD